MPLTPGERIALRWLLVVIMIGSGAKLIRHWRDGSGIASGDSAALTSQIAAVDSLRRADGGGSAGRRGGSRTGRRRARRGASAAGDSAAPSPVPVGVAPGREVPTLTPVDIDVADSAALERLPRIGPSLASRIVAERLRRGPYGSPEGLQRVRGIGPKLAELLRPRVTFSGTPRPSSVQR